MNIVSWVSGNECADMLINKALAAKRIKSERLPVTYWIVAIHFGLERT